MIRPRGWHPQGATDAPSQPTSISKEAPCRPYEAIWGPAEGTPLAEIGGAEKTTWGDWRPGKAAPAPFPGFDTSWSSWRLTHPETALLGGGGAER